MVTTIIVFAAIVIAILMVLWGIVRFFFNIDLITLFFLPDIINGIFVLFSILLQIFGLMFSRAGLAFMFFVVIIIGFVVDALKLL
jgi:hypothetical protein